MEPSEKKLRIAHDAGPWISFSIPEPYTDGKANFAVFFNGTKLVCAHPDLPAIAIDGKTESEE